MDFKEFVNSDFAKGRHLMLIGHPVSHSVSPQMHNFAADYYDLDLNYIAVDIPEPDLSSLAAHFNSDNFVGANVTVPYKKMMIDYADRLDDVSTNVGAVNTLHKEGYELIGSNTDVYGFRQPLGEYEDRLDGSRVLIFGTGGAARACVTALQQMNVSNVYLISRTPASTTSFDEYPDVNVFGYDEWAALSEEAALVVNSTPLGMFPDVNSSPVRDGEKQFLSGKICYDIVYNPQETKFLKQARSVGAKTIGGLDMLIHQGSKSFEIWTGRRFPVTEVKEMLNEHFEN